MHTFLLTFELQTVNSLSVKLIPSSTVAARQVGSGNHRQRLQDAFGRLTNKWKNVSAVVVYIVKSSIPTSDDKIYRY